MLLRIQLDISNCSQTPSHPLSSGAEFAARATRDSSAHVGYLRLDKPQLVVLYKLSVLSWMHNQGNRWRRESLNLGLRSATRQLQRYARSVQDDDVSAQLTQPCPIRSRSWRDIFKLFYPRRHDISSANAGRQMLLHCCCRINNSRRANFRLHPSTLLSFIAGACSNTSC